jgi:hypothetical protein
MESEQFGKTFVPRYNILVLHYNSVSHVQFCYFTVPTECWLRREIGTVQFHTLNFLRCVGISMCMGQT